MLLQSIGASCNSHQYQRYSPQAVTDQLQAAGFLLARAPPRPIVPFSPMPRKAKATGKTPESEPEIGFEEAIEQLEEITRKLESGALSLDESIRAYETGMRLRQICSQMLSRAEKKLEYLERRADGTLEKQDILTEDGAAEGSDSAGDSTDQTRLFQES